MGMGCDGHGHELRDVNVEIESSYASIVAEPKPGSSIRVRHN